MTLTWLGSARALLDAGVLLVFGTAIYRLAVGAVPALAWHWLLGVGAICAWLGGVPALLLTVGGLIDDTHLAAILGAVPLVLTGTVFGPALVARLVLVTAAAALGRYRVASLVVAGFAVLTQVELGHPAAAEDWILPVGAALHVLGVGGWIGSLPALFVAFRTDRRAARRYVTLGLGAMLALIAGAVMEAWDLMGGVPGLLHTAYGHVILWKSGLLVLLVGCAAANRFVLGPALGGPRRVAAARGLAGLMGVAMVLGLAAIWLAATLSGMEPGTHMQPG